MRRRLDLAVLVAALTVSAASFCEAAVRPTVARPSFAGPIVDNTAMAAYYKFITRFRPKDSYDAIPSENDLASKPFELSFFLDTDNLFDWTPIVAGKYDPRTERLTLALTPTISLQSDFGGTLNIPRRGIPSAAVWHDWSEAKPPGRASLDERILLADPDLKHMESLPAVEMAMPRDVARKELLFARVVVRGHFATFSDNTVSICAVRSDPDGNDDRSIDYRRECLFRAHIEQVTVTGASKSVLADWKPATQPEKY